MPPHFYFIFNLPVLSGGERITEGWSGPAHRFIRQRHNGHQGLGGFSYVHQNDDVMIWVT